MRDAAGREFGPGDYFIYAQRGAYMLYIGKALSFVSSTGKLMRVILHSIAPGGESRFDEVYGETTCYVISYAEAMKIITTNGLKVRKEFGETGIES